MAQNGWYIEKITTDLQTGKVDEFVKKEGKYYNYIKGEDTTFTNAADNGGNADGNLDTQEFTVQGIGNLVSNSIVVEGNTPQQGGNIIIEIQGGSNANWSATTINLNNILEVGPGTSTETINFVITADPSYAVVASNFTNANISLPALIDSIIFTNTGTPGTAANEVQGQIVFNASTFQNAPNGPWDYSGAPSGQTATETITINNVNAGNAATQYSANFIINGIFSTAQGQQDTYVNYGTSNYTQAPTITQVSSAQEIYSITDALAYNNTPAFMLTLLVTSGPDTLFDGSASVDLSALPLAEQSLYDVIITNISSTQVQVMIKYTADGAQAQDGLNDITINLGSVNGTLEFNTASVGLPGVTGFQDISINSNYPVWTIAQASPSQSWITGLQFINQTTARIFFDDNVTGSARTHTLELYSPSNISSTPNDTISITQAFITTPTINLYASVQQTNLQGFSDFSTPPSNNLGFTSLESTGAGTGTTGLALPAEGCFIGVAAEITFPATGGGFGQLGQGLFFGNAAGIVDFNTLNTLAFSNTLEQHSFQVLPNTTTSARSFTVTHTHPDDPTVQDTMVIEQEAGYDQAVNTFDLFQENATSNTTGVYDAVSNTLEITNTAQTLDFYAKIPPADTTSDNWFEFSANIPQLSQISQEVASVNSAALVGNLNITTGFVNGQFVITNTTFNYSLVDYQVDPFFDVPTHNSFVPAAGTQVNEFFQISFDNNTEYAALSNGEAFPVQRSVELTFKNPENNTTVPDKTLLVTQKAMPMCYFKDNYISNGSATGIYTAYSTSFNLPVLCNNAPPVVGCYEVEDVNNPGTYIIGNASWLTVGSPSLSNNNQQLGVEYDVSFNLTGNFTGSTRRARIAAYHEEVPVNDQFTVNANPNTSSFTADSMLIEQPPTTIGAFEITEAGGFATGPFYTLNGQGGTYLDSSFVTSNTVIETYSLHYYNNNASVGDVVTTNLKYNYNGTNNALLSPAFPGALSPYNNPMFTTTNFNGSNTPLVFTPTVGPQSLTFTYQVESAQKVFVGFYKHYNTEKYILLYIYINPPTSPAP